jgi:SAM-dependent methyltransferase
MDWTESWAGFVLNGYDSADFAVGGRILEIGFGAGKELMQLAARGCYPIGVELNRELAKNVIADKIPAVIARAEQLPFRTNSFDGVISKVMLPYTDEEKVVAEIGRVLRPGCECDLVAHGLGYYLAYLLVSRMPRRRIYALRTIVNTWLYRVTRLRWIGDTIYQSISRLRCCFHRNRLQIIRHTHTRVFCGVPVFIYLRVRKLSPAHDSFLGE